MVRVQSESLVSNFRFGTNICPWHAVQWCRQFYRAEFLGSMSRYAAHESAERQIWKPVCLHLASHVLALCIGGTIKGSFVLHFAPFHHDPNLYLIPIDCWIYPRGRYLRSFIYNVRTAVVHSDAAREDHPLSGRTTLSLRRQCGILQAIRFFVQDPSRSQDIA